MAACCCCCAAAPRAFPGEMVTVAVLRTGGAMGPKGEPYETGQGDRLLSGDLAAVIHEC